MTKKLLIRCSFDGFFSTGYHPDPNQCYQNANIQKIYKDSALTQLDQELDITLNEIAKKKPLWHPESLTKQNLTQTQRANQKCQA